MQMFLNKTVSRGFIVVAIFAVNLAGGQTQNITSNPSSISVGAGETFTFDVSYTTDPLDETLAGLTLRMHFDSSRLTFSQLQNLLDTGFNQQQVQDDTEDFDSDSATDKYLNVLWLDLGGNWPGNGTLPQRLYTTEFTADATFSSTTTINFTAQTSTGYTFQSSSVVVQKIKRTLTYSAGANGSLSGTSPQTVDHGADGTAVTAIPAAGYHFVDWSDGSTANPRTDTGVTADITVTANFATDTYTLTYSAGANGSLSGTSPQTVDHGADGTAVTA